MYGCSAIHNTQSMSICELYGVCEGRVSCARVCEDYCRDGVGLGEKRGMAQLKYVEGESARWKEREEGEVWARAGGRRTYKCH
jgi:hypothetical protein